MPKFLERLLAKEADKKNLGKKRTGAYVYGTLNKLGLMKGSKETSKGKEADKKHLRDMLKNKA